MHAPEGYGSHYVCVCVSVCLLYIFSDIVHLNVTTMIVISFAWYSPDFYKHDFCEKALFRSYGVIMVAIFRELLYSTLVVQ